MALLTFISGVAVGKFDLLSVIGFIVYLNPRDQHICNIQHVATHENNKIISSFSFIYKVF